MSKCAKRLWNHYKYKKKSLLKTCLKYYSLSWLHFKTSQALRRKENYNSVTKSFRLSTKRKLSILLNFLFPAVSFNDVFSTLKCNSLVLETTAWSTRGSHFVEKGILHYRVHLGVKSFSSLTPIKLLNIWSGDSDLSIVCADGWSYADVISKFSRVDRFSFFYSRGGSANSLFLFLLFCHTE